MSWNYRVLVHKNEDDVCLQIHEVYYDKDGKLKSYTKNGANVIGDCFLDLEWTLNEMIKCLEKPMLSAENFPNIYKE